MNRETALATKLFLPRMVQVTWVCSPSGWKMKSVKLVALNGRRKSSCIRAETGGLLSRMVILPAPTLLLPDQLYEAPGPEGGPSKVMVAFGSSLAQGDHASQLRSVLTCSNTTAGGAAMVAER